MKAMQISRGQIIKGLICLESNWIFAVVISDSFYLGSRKVTPLLGNIFKGDTNTSGRVVVLLH